MTRLITLINHAVACGYAISALHTKNGDMMLAAIFFMLLAIYWQHGGLRSAQLKKLAGEK